MNTNFLMNDRSLVVIDDSPHRANEILSTEQKLRKKS